MGLFALILNIISLFTMLPKIWETIRTIIEIIKLLKSPEEKSLAKKELKAVLIKYVKTNKNDKQQVAYQGKSLQVELDELKSKLEAKVSAK